MMYPFGYAILVTLIVCLTVRRLRRRFPTAKASSLNCWSLSGQGLQRTQPDPSCKLRPIANRQQTDRLRSYKSLYHKLHNLEKHPDILGEAWDVLVSLLSETISFAKNSKDQGIFSITTYTPEALDRFLLAKSENTTEQWEAYMSRRKAGQPREFLQDKEAGIEYLKQNAPLKLVDGAWLGHMHKVTTPYPLRHVTKMAWQVFSEELGDGSLEKNHVSIYSSLLESVGVELPRPNELAFTEPQVGLDDVITWKAALSQLLISLFPNEFLPEILGYNLAFEAVTMSTLTASKELEEVGINAYYFLVHVTIDNSDSGHTAMAAKAVLTYLDWVRRDHGEPAVDDAWRRVQAGYVLAEGFPEGSTSSRPAPETEIDASLEVAKLFERKVSVANGLHCNSRLKISGRTLEDWLDPTAFASAQWQRDFFAALSNARPWVRKGDSDNSKLVQELCWGGRMFGAFTDQEAAVLKRWIDGLAEADTRAYWSFTGRPGTSFLDSIRGTDITHDHSVVHCMDLKGATDLSFHLSSARMDIHRPLLIDKDRPKTADFLPLWFTHACVLSGFIATPVRAASRIGEASLRVLRAQHGFDLEGSIVSGMDEILKDESVGIIELGLEMMNSLGQPVPHQLRDVCSGRNSAFAVQLLRLSTKPEENASLLLGLSWSFMQLHEAMINSEWLPPHRRVVLKEIARREREGLAVCLEAVKVEGSSWHEVEKGYAIGRRGVEECF